MNKTGKLILIVGLVIVAILFVPKLIASMIPKTANTPQAPTVSGASASRGKKTILGKITGGAVELLPLFSNDPNVTKVADVANQFTV